MQHGHNHYLLKEVGFLVCGRKSFLGGGEVGGEFGHVAVRPIASNTL